MNQTKNEKSKSTAKEDNSQLITRLLETINDALKSRSVNELIDKLMIDMTALFKPYAIEIYINDPDKDNIDHYSLQNGNTLSRSIHEIPEKKEILDIMKEIELSKVKITTRLADNSMNHYDMPFSDQIGNVYGLICLSREKEFDSDEMQILTHFGSIYSGLLLWLFNREFMERQIKDKNKTISSIHSQLKETHNLNMKTITQLVAGIAHEINNPLAGLKGGAEGLKDNISDMTNMLTSITHGNEYDDSEFNYLMMEGIPDSISAIVSSADRLRDLILNLKQFSRLGVSDLSNLDITRRITMFIEQYKAKIEQNNVTVNLDLADNVKIKCYNQEISMVLSQLLENAIYYAARSEKDKKILITLREENSEIHLSYLDTGFGIPVENEETVFQPFFTTKNIGEGIGLGLSVCYGIVMNHQGKIFVDKEREKGEEDYTTKLTVILPKTFEE
jgi:signal transduction histidine kinase